MASPATFSPAPPGVMLAIYEKRTTSIDLYRPLRNYIAAHYSEREAQLLEDDLQAVRKLRSDLEKPPESSVLEVRCHTLEAYARALALMEPRFPISADRAHINALTFTWFNAFRPNETAAQQNIQLEKAGVLFNLGAVYSQMGLAADRSTQAGLEQACNFFQAAAGVFAFLRDNVSMKAVIGGATADVSAECARMLERLVLAQAQECLFEKVITDGKPPELCSKVARQVGLYYEEAYAALSAVPLSQHFSCTWISHVQLKAAHFYAEACYRYSLKLHMKGEIAEEIARLKIGLGALVEAKKSAKGVAAPLLDAASRLESNINQNLERAVKEHDQVDLMRVLAASTLMSLPAASLVKPLPMDDVLVASKDKLFSTLVPDNNTKALFEYTEMVDDIIRNQAEKLQQASEITRIRLKEMDLPDSILPLEGNFSLPMDLKDAVKAVQISGGLSVPEAELWQLHSLRRVNEELLVQSEELLEKEARKDVQFHIQFGTQWTGPQLSTLAKSTWDRLNRFSGNIKQASDSDACIKFALKDNKDLMSILDHWLFFTIKLPVESALPSLARPIMSLDANEDDIVRALKQSLRQLKALGVQRAGLVDMLKEMKRKDDILPKLMLCTGSYEDLLKKEISKYEHVCEQVAQNIKAQEQLLLQIQAQNDDFAAVIDFEDYKENPSKIDKSISKLSKETIKLASWQCSICMFDNEQSSSSCDMCGCIRDSTKEFGNGGEEKVHGDCKDSGASIMAKSLFARLHFPKFETSISPKDYISKRGDKAFDKGKTQASLDELQETCISSRQKHSINIVPFKLTVPFKFDTLSPDDLVTLGKGSRISSKVPVTASANTTRKKGIVEFSASEIPESSSAVSLEANHVLDVESSTSMDNDEAPQIVACNLHQVKLDKNSTNIRKAKPISEYKPEKWMLSHEAGTLSQLNVAIVGHVDSGKSTLSGRLLHLLGRVSKKEMHKFEKEAKELGKRSFAFAWAMDESAEERERGVTMTVAVAYFESKRYRVVLLDSPGHKDFVPNMISGATQADAAVLVVDASAGSFEAGMDGHGFGQTKEHAQLIRSFGVEQILVAVNKMDSMGFSKDRFDFIKLQLGTFLRLCGFKEASIIWVPLSAIENQNLVAPASDPHLTSWYKGCCLLEGIESFQLPLRDVSKPLLLPICDVTTSHSLGRVSACGKLESGAIQSGSKVIVMPSGDLATVRAIERDSCSCSVAKAGDNVAVSLHGIDTNLVMPGGVLCHPDYPVTVASSLELRVLVLDVTTPILIGSQVEFHVHHAKEAARVVKIVSLLDQKTGKASKKTPRFLTAKQSAMLEVALDAAVCVEEFYKNRALGRVFLRSSGCTVAVGIVTRVLE